MIKYFFSKKTFYMFLVFAFFVPNDFIASAQYIELGEYRYRADRPPFKDYVTYSYDNVLGVVDSNVLPDRYTKTVIVVDEEAYNRVLSYIEKNRAYESENVNPESYRYICIRNVERERVVFYKFSFDNFKLYLIDLIKFIENSNYIHSEYKLELISRLEYWK